MDAKSKLKLKWLVIFYISFMLFAIPYSTFNGIWPIISKDLNVLETNLGILSSIFLFTQAVFLSFASYIIYKFGSRATTGIGILLISISLIIFSKTQSFVTCMIGIFLLACGSGITNTTANFFLAVHYDAKRMGGLHAVWGLGSALGPMIMTQILLKGLTYRQGFLVMTPFFVVYAIFMLSSKIIDTKHNLEKKEKEAIKEIEKNKISIKEIFTAKNALLFLCCMFLGEFLHSSMVVWYSTFVVVQHNVDPVIAANILSAYFIGLTITRVLCGFIAEKFGTRKVILSGLILYSIFALILVLNISNLPILAISGVLIGVGAASATPLLMSLTKESFDNKLLQSIVGLAGTFGQLGGFISTVLISNFTSIFSMRWFAYIIFTFSIIAILVVRRFINTSKK